jgi:hypothetical protein
MEPYLPATEAITDALNAACMVVTDALIMEDVELSPRLIDQTIPGIVYRLAVRVGLWREPEAMTPGPDTVDLGGYDVSKAERAYFASLLEDSLSFLREELESDPKRTPAEIFEEYRKTHDLTWEKLAERLQVGEYTLRDRICNPKYKFTPKKSTLEPIAKVLGCHWRDLLWKPRK